MSDHINTGGPAYPARPTEHLSSGGTITAHHGMSLRDYFAGQVASECFVQIIRVNDTGLPPKDVIAAAAAWSYQIADAMILARGEGQ